MKLYELTEQLKDFNELVESGEIPEDAVRDTFESLEGQFNDKAISCGHYLKSLEAESEVIDIEIKRLTALKKTRQNALDKFKDYLRENMERTNINKIECPLFSISLGVSQDVVEISDLNSLPKEYKKVKTEADKTAIKKALKAGEDIPGAKLEKGKSKLTIR